MHIQLRKSLVCYSELFWLAYSVSLDNSCIAMKLILHLRTLIKIYFIVQLNPCIQDVHLGISLKYYDYQGVLISLICKWVFWDCYQVKVSLFIRRSDYEDVPIFKCSD